MNQSITLKFLTSFVTAVLLALPAGVSAASPKGKLANPDFTKGESVPEGFTHDWNLGPTGAGQSNTRKHARARLKAAVLSAKSCQIMNLKHDWIDWMTHENAGS